MPLADALPTARLQRALQSARTVVELGRVVQAAGTVLRATGLHARIGQQCEVFDPAQTDGVATLPAEVIGFSGSEMILAPYGSLRQLPVGAAVRALADDASVPSGEGVLGRVIDAFGRPLDGAPLRQSGVRPAPLHAPAPLPLVRRPIASAFPTGIRA